ncbi:MAG: hypothetical protein JWO06_2142 [Bacteroidota bacterium]|nr:hypothetical protein [Bacteroidota bacterium]
MKEKAPAKKKKVEKNASPDVAMKYHMISKYRDLVAKRYDYESIKSNPNVPDDFTKKMVETLKVYFLESLYPEPVLREKLDAAFSELENYVMHPSKVWHLLGNITAAIFRFGFQFPAAVGAGLTSLTAYTSAKHFENSLTQAALEKGYTIPVSDEQFFQCMVAIPKDELYRFIGELENLFKSFTNTVLLGKTIGIMDTVIETMKSKPDLYGPNEVEAIELGKAIMQKGYDLFTQYDEHMKEEILEFIKTNEKNFIDSLY